MDTSKLTLPVVKELLPKIVRMTYAGRDVLNIALEVGDNHEVMCEEAGPAEFVAVYKLVRVEKAR